MPAVHSSWKDKDQLLADAKLFEGVGFLVSASSHEMHTLWREYYDKPRPDATLLKQWTEETRGHMITIGSVVDRPVCVSIFFAILDGVRVLFYEGVSQLVDHLMIEQWLRYHTEKTVRWDKGHRWAHTNAENFHHCLQAVQVKAAG